MKIKKLKDRSGNVFTPLVHKDSVVDVNGVPLKNWIAPISVNGTAQGYSNETDFANGTQITVTGTRVANSDGTYHNQIVMSHNNVSTGSTTTDISPSSGQDTVVVGSITTDQQGHVTQISSKRITLPQDVTVGIATSTVYLTGVANKTGVNGVKSAEQATYDPLTGTITAPLINAELVGGAKGSLVYQTSTNVTGMLPIGTNAQVLSVSSSGVPEWVDKTNGLVSQSSWVSGTSAGPVPVFTLENGYNTTKTLNGSAIPSATDSQSGVITTGAQSFSGNKTFKDDVVIEKDLTVKGNIVAVEQKDIVVSDKVITLAASTSASVSTGSGSGVEVTTYYDANAQSEGEKYLGPSFLWDKDSGWTTGNSGDPTPRSTDINIGNKDTNTEGVLRINGAQVLSSTQYTGNSATATKVNNSITFGANNEKSFDGSSSVHIGLNDLADGPLTVSRGGTGYDTLTLNTIILGNGSSAVKFLSNGTEHQAVVISSAGVPAYETLTLDHIPAVAFTLYESTNLSDVDDFAV